MIPIEAKSLEWLVPETAEFKKRKKDYLEFLQYEKLAQNPDLQVLSRWAKLSFLKQQSTTFSNWQTTQFQANPGI